MLQAPFSSPLRHVSQQQHNIIIEATTTISIITMTTATTIPITECHFRKNILFRPKSTKTEHGNIRPLVVQYTNIGFTKFGV
jgi:hypothetical protein